MIGDAVADPLEPLAGLCRPRARPARLRHEERLGLVVLGLSGGIDSALVACPRCRRAGADRSAWRSRCRRLLGSGTQDERRAGREPRRRDLRVRHPPPHGPTTRSSPTSSRPPSPASPRKNLQCAYRRQPAHGARTSSAGRPDHRQQVECRSAPPRSTATWPAASRSSRTCRKLLVYDLVATDQVAAAAAPVSIIERRLSAELREASATRTPFPV